MSESIRPKENAAPETHRVVAALLRKLEGCRRILDIPCGVGSLLLHLEGAGFDIDAADCEDLPTRVPGVVFSLADMNRPLPYPANQFDAVVSIDGIEHIERTFDFVRECRRILRPGGTLIVTTPNISALRSRWRWFLTGFHNKAKSPLDEAHPNPLHHIRMMSLPDLRYVLHTNGFRVTAVCTNRIKAISWVYALWAPLVYLATAWVFASEEHDPAQRLRNREILAELFSRPVLFGETLIVMAQCEDQRAHP